MNNIGVSAVIAAYFTLMTSILGFAWIAKKLGLWNDGNSNPPNVPPMIASPVYEDIAIILLEAINRLGASGIRPIYDPSQIVDPRCLARRLKNGATAAVFRLPCDTEKLPRASVFQHRLQDEVDRSTAWGGLPSLVVHTTYEPHRGGVVIQVAAKSDLCRGIRI